MHSIFEGYGDRGCNKWKCLIHETAATDLSQSWIVSCTAAEKHDHVELATCLYSLDMLDLLTTLRKLFLA